MNLEEARRAKTELQKTIRELEDKEFIDSGEFMNQVNILLDNILHNLSKSDMSWREKFSQANIRVNVMKYAESRLRGGK